MKGPKMAYLRQRTRAAISNTEGTHSCQPSSQSLTAQASNQTLRQVYRSALGTHHTRLISQMHRLSRKETRFPRHDAEHARLTVYERKVFLVRPMTVL